MQLNNYEKQLVLAMNLQCKENIPAAVELMQSVVDTLKKCNIDALAMVNSIPVSIGMTSVLLGDAADVSQFARPDAAFLTKILGDVYNAAKVALAAGDTALAKNIVRSVTNVDYDLSTPLPTHLHPLPLYQEAENRA